VVSAGRLAIGRAFGRFLASASVVAPERWLRWEPPCRVADRSELARRPSGSRCDGVYRRRALGVLTAAGTLSRSGLRSSGRRGLRSRKSLPLPASARSRRRRDIRLPSGSLCVGGNGCRVASATSCFFARRARTPFVRAGCSQQAFVVTHLHEIVAHRFRGWFEIGSRVATPQARDVMYGIDTASARRPRSSLCDPAFMPCPIHSSEITGASA